MAVNVSGKVWELNLPAVDKLVLLALTDHADSEGKNIRPGNALLCAKTGLSERTITAKIASFIERGILEPVHDISGRGHIREFEVHLEDLPRHRHFIEKDREKVARRSTFKARQKVAVDDRKVESDAQKVESDDRKVESDSSALIGIEPSRTVNEPSESTPALIFDEIFPGKRNFFITEAIDSSSITNEEVWRAALERWRMNGYSLRNIGGMIDSYKNLTEKSDGKSEWQRKRDEFTRSTREAFAAQEAARERNRANRPEERPVVYITPPTLADRLAAEKRRRDAESGVSLV